jgi:hypothetical protein
MRALDSTLGPEDREELQRTDTTRWIGACSRGGAGRTGMNWGPQGWARWTPSPMPGCHALRTSCSRRRGPVRQGCLRQAAATFCLAHVVILLQQAVQVMLNTPGKTVIFRRSPLLSNPLVVSHGSQMPLILIYQLLAYLIFGKWWHRCMQRRSSNNTGRVKGENSRLPRTTSCLLSWEPQFLLQCNQLYREMTKLNPLFFFCEETEPANNCSHVSVFAGCYQDSSFTSDPLS